MPLYSQRSKEVSHSTTGGLLSRKDAAEFLGIKEHTLAVWTTTHKYHLPYVKVGRLVRYRLSDLQNFLEQNLHQ